MPGTWSNGGTTGAPKDGAALPADIVACSGSAAGTYTNFQSAYVAAASKSGPFEAEPEVFIGLPVDRLWTPMMPPSGAAIVAHCGAPFIGSR